MPFSDILRTYNSKRPELLPYGLECDKRKPDLIWKSDRHNEIKINYMIDGSFTYLIKGKKVRIEANTIATFGFCSHIRLLKRRARSINIRSTILSDKSKEL
jgi:hypothetical protein